MEEDNPFNQYVLKEFGRQHQNKFVRKVCSCGKKNNLQCKRRFCSSCCVASGESLSKPGRKPAGVGRKRTRSGVVMVPSDLKDTVFPDGNIMLSPQILADMYDRVGFSSRTRDSTGHSTLSAYWDLVFGVTGKFTGPHFSQARTEWKQYVSKRDNLR